MKIEQLRNKVLTMYKNILPHRFDNPDDVFVIRKIEYYWGWFKVTGRFKTRKHERIFSEDEFLELVNTGSVDTGYYTFCVKDVKDFEGTMLHHDLRFTL